MEQKRHFVNKGTSIVTSVCEMSAGVDDLVGDSSRCNPCTINQTEAPAVYWCIECTESLCSKCASYHKSYKALKDHHIVDLNEKASLQMLRYWFATSCKEHPNRQVQYFCKDDGKICCNDCIVNKHGKFRNTISLEIASKGMVSSKYLDSCTHNLNEMLKHLTNLSTTGFPNKDFLQTVGPQIEIEIRQTKKELIESINKREQELLFQLKTLINECTSTINDNSRSILQTIEKVNNDKKMLAYFFNNASDKQVFVHIDTVKGYLEKLESDIISLTNCVRKFTLNFKKTSYFDLIGTVERKINKKSNIKWKSCNFDSLSRELSIDRSSASSYDYYSGSEYQSFNLHNEINVLHRLVTGIAVTHDERILLCDSTVGSNKVVAYDKNGQLLKEIQMAYTPWNIKIIPNSVTAVVTFGEKCFQFIDINSLSTGREVKVSDNDRLFGIAATTEEILTGGEGKVYVHDVNGSFESKMTLAGGTIYYIHIGSPNKYYYSDSQRIFCIKPDGTALFSYTINQVSPYCGIETDCWGNVYVSENKTNKIEKLKPDGSAHGSVLDKDNGIYMPLAICFSICHDFFYVSVQGQSEDSNKILCFKCDGNLC